MYYIQYTYIGLHIHIYIYVYETYIYIYMYAYTSTCVYIYIYIYTYIYTYILLARLRRALHDDREDEVHDACRTSKYIFFITCVIFMYLSIILFIIFIIIIYCLSYKLLFIIMFYPSPRATCKHDDHRVRVMTVFPAFSVRRASPRREKPRR